MCTPVFSPSFFSLCASVFQRAFGVIRLPFCDKNSCQRKRALFLKPTFKAPEVAAVLFTGFDPFFFRRKLVEKDVDEICHECSSFNMLCFNVDILYNILYTDYATAFEGDVVMRIAGVQKLTLLDYPGKIACTVFLSGCNLRCPYCHNPGLVLPEWGNESEMSVAEVLAFLERRKGKMDGVCVTGGEPTLQPELPAFLKKLRSLGFAVKLDTNGTNPEMLKALMHDGILDYVAMDIKNSPSRYAETCGGADVLFKAQESAGLLLQGAAEYEFRTTVCKPLHTERDMAEIGRWLRGTKRYFLQAFVDSGDLVSGGVQAHTQEELARLRQAVLPYIPNTQLRGV